MLRSITFYRLIQKKSFSSKSAPIFSYKEKPNVEEIEHDYIGPPDKKSNLRPILRHIPKNETKLQTVLRVQRLEVEQWNQTFWTNHNERFYEERKKFIAANKTSESDTLSADRMSEFYKSFLDKNWRLHFYYNISWHIKNWELFFLAIRVNFEKLYKRK